MTTQLAIKVDVDTERGTRLGVPKLLDLFKQYRIKSTFLFSLGPDNTGRAIKRIFRRGFLKKVQRTSIVSTYGLRTLLNGVLLPGPHIGRRHAAIMQCTEKYGHEVGIHCHDHVYWQDNLHKLSYTEIKNELAKANLEFQRIFKRPARTAGAAGWQANAFSLRAYDEANFIYGSDCRGYSAFIPVCSGQIFKTLQIPTTLPTLDELIGRPEYPTSTMTEFYLQQIKSNQLNVMTIHAEIEGMKHFAWFSELVKLAIQKNIEFVTLEDLAIKYSMQLETLEKCQIIQGEIDGRSGTLALQCNKPSKQGKQHESNQLSKRVQQSICE